MQIILKELNVESKIKLREDGEWGILKNGSWNGMIGALVRREIDIATGAITVITDRSNVVDFSITIFNEDGALLVKTEINGSKLNIFAFLYIFK